LCTVIGRGQNTTIYQAIDKIFRRKVAVKTFKPSEFARIEAEIAVLECIEHPNVVAMLEMLFGTKKNYLVMELARVGPIR
jgi:serine/threonine protein kinase